MAESNTQEFKVPDCFLPTAAAPGDIIVRITSANWSAQAGQVTEFSCHSVILLYNCDYFKTLLSGDWKENQNKGLSSSGQMTDSVGNGHSASVLIRARIDFPDESPQTFLQVLNHLYPHLSLQLSKDNWQDVWRLADKLGITGLVAHCEKYMRDEVLNVDPLTVLGWATRTRQEDCFRQSSILVLDRMASGQIKELGALPHAVQIALLNKRYYMTKKIFSFAERVGEIIVSKCPYVRLDWYKLTREAAAIPSPANGVKLLQTALCTKKGFGYMAEIVALAEKYRPFISQWNVKLPNLVEVLADQRESRTTDDTRQTKKARTMD